MTKTEEAHMLRDIKRTAAATERIAKALEQLVKMATYDAEDYVKLGQAVSDGIAVGIDVGKEEE